MIPTGPDDDSRLNRLCVAPAADTVIHRVLALQLRPIPPRLRGEAGGDTAPFTAQSQWLSTYTAIDEVPPSLTARTGLLHQPVVRLPEGQRHGRDAEPMSAPSRPWRWSHGLAAVAAMGLLLCAGCKRSEPPNSKPLVVASFFPLYDLARQIAGTNCEVRCLVPSGGDPHHEDPTPDRARLVERADVVLLLGLGMDGWVEKLARNGPTNRGVVLSEGLATRTMGVSALAEFAAEQPDPNETDPHLWLDPLLAEMLVRRITAELVTRVPNHAAALQARGDALAADLRTLHGEFESGLAGLPHRKVVTFHGAYGYLFARYRLETAGVIEPFPGDEPSAAYLRALVDLMRRLGLKIIFAEPQLPDRPAQVIAREIGGRVERLDPCETILPEAPDATYQVRQRRNLATLRQALEAR
jgi:zinc transport system substrate-binding protein